MITIYIPAKNASKYLREAIDSVLSQTCQDFELILINDGSTDGTIYIMKEYDWDKRISVLSFKKSHGVAYCANTALRLAQGNYFMRLDADDKLDINALSVMSSYMDAHQDVGLVYPDYYKMDEDGNICEVIRQDNLETEWVVLDQPPHGACTMFRTSLLKQLDGYAEGYSRQDGTEIWFKFIKQYKPHNINIPLFYYRRHINPACVSLSTDVALVSKERTRIKQNTIDQPECLGVIMATVKSIYPQSGALEPINGKRMIDYTIKAACDSKLSDIVVSTPDVHIVDYVRKRHADIKIIQRPTTDSYFLNPSVVALRALGGTEYDLACILFVNCPLREAHHIDEAVYHREIFEFDSVVSVEQEPSFMYRKLRDSLEPVGRVSRQIKIEREMLFRENGAIYVVTKEQLEHGHIVGGKIGYIVMQPEESIKINSSYEHWLAEQLLRRRNV